MNTFLERVRNILSRHIEQSLLVGEDPKRGLNFINTEHLIRQIELLEKLNDRLDSRK